MSEENKNTLTPENVGKEQTDSGQSDEKLNEELEQLRETFQNTYNETAKNAEEDDGEPVIQGLDYSGDTDDDGGDGDADHDSDTDSYTPTEPQQNEKKKKKKRMSGGYIACIIIMIISLCTSAFLGTAVFEMISVPDMAYYMSNFLKASSAENAADKVKYFKSALEVCSSGSGLESKRQELIENIVVYTCESEGYSAAKTFFDENGTDDMKKSPKTKSFKEFTEVGDKISEIADKAFDAVQPYVTKDGDPDFKKLAKELGATDLILTDTESALKNIYDGSVYAETAKSETEVQLSSKSYLTAYQTLKGMGASCQTLLERTALMLYNNGYAYEANIIIDNYMTKDMLASPVTAEFTQMQNDIKSASAFKGDIFTIASAEFEAGKTANDDFSALVTGDGLSDKIKSSVASLIADLVEALTNEQEANLTKALSLYSVALDSAKAFGISTNGLAWKTTEIMLKTGNIQGANEIATGYLTEDDVKAATEAQSALYTNVTKLYAAQKAANDIFYSAYANYYYSGTAIDKTSVNTKLDGLITSTSNSFDKAMVAYYKYLTEAFTDKDSSAMRKYLEEYASLLRDYPLVYSYDLIGQYITDKNYEEAFKLTDAVLAINKADDFAGKYAALRERMNGSVEKALETAEKSMELSGETNYTAYEAALCYLILGNYEKAIELTSPLVEAGLSYDLCDLVKVLEALYTEKEGEAAETLKSLVATVDNTLSQNSIDVSENAKAIIDGTKTAKDVLMSGTYNFS
ncbi:MAG: hypothetical protein SOX69_09860 [Oscillospiraceae bacterium]|nr:hypothetical protein [Oscillospiraceae bacterium]